LFLCVFEFVPNDDDENDGEEEENCRDDDGFPKGVFVALRLDLAVGDAVLDLAAAVGAVAVEGGATRH
jgi:hypothetical protein